MKAPRFCMFRIGAIAVRRADTSGNGRPLHARHGQNDPEIALGRKNYLFMGSERGGKSAAIAYTLIETAKLSGIDPQAWLTDVLARIADHKITRLCELTPWSYTRQGRV